MLLCFLFFFFFFQAEDGIRDLIVTGVQTCALPISAGDGWARGAVKAATCPRHLRDCNNGPSHALTPLVFFFLRTVSPPSRLPRAPSTAPSACLSAATSFRAFLIGAEFQTGGDVDGGRAGCPGGRRAQAQGQGVRRDRRRPGNRAGGGETAGPGRRENRGG